MTPAQRQSLTRMLRRLYARAVADREEPWFDHGDCLGVDAQAHIIAVDIGFHIEAHPPTNSTHRAYSFLVTPPRRYSRQCEPCDYLIRNQNIVRTSVCLLAVPETDREELRSGTWSTVRYARQVKLAHTLILPDGTINTVRY